MDSKVIFLGKLLEFLFKVEVVTSIKLAVFMEDKQMWNIFKKICKVTCIFVLLAISITGCGNNESISSEGPIVSKAMFSAKDAIKIEDIPWNVTESIMDGKRFISFNYTNNSKYVIMDVEMKFKQKEGTIIDQLAVFDELKATYEWSDEEIAELYILGYNRKFADPGETASDSPCVVNGTYILVENMKQFEIMEPDTVDIAFIGDDGKGYVIYYDFKTKAYGESSQGAQDLQQWSKSKISSLLPKANFKATKVSTDDENDFFFYAYGVSREEYEAYVDAVKLNGFTEVGFEESNSYRASNKDGIEANITFNAVEETLTGSVEPE